MLKYYIFIVILGAFCVSLIITTFSITGNPFKQKAIQDDAQRTSSFDQIKYSIDNYFSVDRRLPASLKDLNIPTYISDPITKKPFDYKRLSGSYYQLCATFETDNSDPNQTNDTAMVLSHTFSNEHHDKGYYCMRDIAGQTGAISSSASIGFFKDLSAELNDREAIFNFVNYQPSSGYSIQVATNYEMTENENALISGTSSPLILENPSSWKSYICGKKIYWQLFSTNDGIQTKSSVQSAIVSCRSATKKVSTNIPPLACQSDSISVWRFADTQTPGDKIKDSCGKNEGLPYGTATDITSKGSVRVFNGTTDYLDFGPLVPAQNVKTIEAWVKFNSLTDKQEIVSKSNVSSGVELLLYEGGLSYYVMGGGDDEHITYPYNYLNTSDFYYVAATHNGPGSTMKLYVNGKLVEIGKAPATIGDSNNLLIGSWQYSPLPRFFNGLINQVRLSNTEHTATQIETEYEKTLGVTSTPTPANVIK